jgi:hypothetical protein
MHHEEKKERRGRLERSAVGTDCLLRPQEELAVPQKIIEMGRDDGDGDGQREGLGFLDSDLAKADHFFMSRESASGRIPAEASGVNTSRELCGRPSFCLRMT